MEWYAIDKDYVNYLKKFDELVPDIDYKNKMKCFLGVVLTTDNIDYFAPLTSYKPKFINMKNDIDFFKIQDKNTDKIFGAIDINNMIPVMTENYTKLTIDNLEQFRDFDSEREKKGYWKLLQKELTLINEKEILVNAEKLYHLKEQHPENNIAKRCCDFKLLEEKCLDYNHDLKEEINKDIDNDYSFSNFE